MITVIFFSFWFVVGAVFFFDITYKDGDDNGWNDIKPYKQKLLVFIGGPFIWALYFCLQFCKYIVPALCRIRLKIKNYFLT
jgi:hypothetical protein